MNLYAHQQKIIDADPKKCGLFLGTGSGKTLTALMLARGRVLVVCPKTQKEDRVWQRQREKAGLLLDDNLNDRKGDLEDFIVVSKEEFKRDWKELVEIRWTTLIVDEAHACLGATPTMKYVMRQQVPKNSQIFDALQSFVEQAKPERIYLCTATIVKNPMTVWAAGTILGKKWDWRDWRDAFYVKLPMPGREVWAPRKDSATKDRLAAAVKQIGYVGRLEDFFDVPDQTFRTIHVELTDEQKQRIREIRMEYPDPIVQIGKIHQIENGILSGNEFAAPERFANQKDAKLAELMEEFPQMIVFARYTAQIEAIRSTVESFGRKAFVLSGQTKNRGEMILEALKTPEYVFICQSQISAGWELPECPAVVFASKTYSFVDYSQALGRPQRAHNIKKNIYISLTVRGGVDDAIDRSIDNKCDFNERIFCDTIYK